MLASLSLLLFLALLTQQPVFEPVGNGTNAQTVGESQKPLPVPVATVYRSQKGEKLSLYAWSGKKTAVLTQSKNLDPKIMRDILTAADGTWDYYAATTGKLPALNLNYNGLASIAEVERTCGAGCTYLGSTGMELMPMVFTWLYDGIQKKVYDQVLFYEMGRSFWLFAPQLNYQAPDSSDCIVTGYAVFMRYRSLAAQHMTGSFNGTPANYDRLFQTMHPMIDAYAADTSLDWGNTFRTSTYKGPNGLGCTDLFASLMYKLLEENGGEDFLRRFYREVAKMPEARSSQAAVDNFVVAASLAAGRSLVGDFEGRWRWPVTAMAKQKITKGLGKSKK